MLTHTFATVLNLIDDGFDAFVENRLFQRAKERQVYENRDLDVVFVHDFTKYKPLSYQMEAVQEKYGRRVERFYNSIRRPTLFLRYIESRDQFEYITGHRDEIIRRLKSYNQYNQIVFIANDYAVIEECKELVEALYIVKPDENDTVARSFFDQCDELVNYMLLCYPSAKRERNLHVYHKKIITKKMRKFPGKFQRLYEKLFLKEYEHTKRV